MEENTQESPIIEIQESSIEEKPVEEAKKEEIKESVEDLKEKSEKEIEEMYNLRKTKGVTTQQLSQIYRDKTEKEIKAELKGYAKRKGDYEYARTLDEETKESKLSLDKKRLYTNMLKVEKTTYKEIAEKEGISFADAHDQIKPQDAFTFEAIEAGVKHVLSKPDVSLEELSNKFRNNPVLAGDREAVKVALNDIEQKETETMEGQRAKSVLRQINIEEEEKKENKAKEEAEKTPEEIEEEENKEMYTLYRRKGLTTKELAQIYYKDDTEKEIDERLKEYVKHNNNGHHEYPITQGQIYYEAVKAGLTTEQISEKLIVDKDKVEEKIEKYKEENKEKIKAEEEKEAQENKENQLEIATKALTTSAEQGDAGGILRGLADICALLATSITGAPINDLTQKTDKEKEEAEQQDNEKKQDEQREENQENSKEDGEGKDSKAGNILNASSSIFNNMAEQSKTEKMFDNMKKNGVRPGDMNQETPNNSVDRSAG